MPAAVTNSLGLTTINGLPAHILIVHAVVVLVPLTAIVLVGVAVSPSLGRRLGVLSPLLAAAGFVSVLLAMNAGSWLRDHVQDSALVRQHTSMAGGLLPFVFVMLVLSVAQWAIGRRSVAPAVGTRYRKVRGAVSLTVVIAVLSVAAAVLSVVQTVRIGESGSRAAWHGHFSPTAISRGGS